MATPDEVPTTGETFSVALDPHRRRCMERAIDRVLSERRSRWTSVALVGWRAATFLDALYDRAERVTVVEDDERLVESIRQGLEVQGRGEKVELIRRPPADVELEDRVDVAVTSANSTWFIEGREAGLLKNIREHMLVEGGTMIPRRLLHLFELAGPPNRVGGMPLRTPRFSRPGEPLPILSESKHFTTTDMTPEGEVPEQVDDTIIVKPLVSGTLTALRLSTLCELTEGVMQTTSQSGVQSILVPVREDIEIEAGQPVNIHVRYEPGRGLENTKFSARSLPEQDTSEWGHRDHDVAEQFQDRIAEMIERAEQRGRAGDLENVVQYTIEPHGDVSRLTAFFWTIDEEYRQPVRDIVDQFRSNASEHIGDVPDDETIYELMLEVYERTFDTEIESLPTS